jgi:hypothetical protein
LPNARIVLHGPINTETRSDARGAFAIDSLPGGMYDIEASASGLNTAITVEVKRGTATVVPIELNMATVASTMTVTAGDPPLTEESAQKSTIGQPIVQEAPNQEEKIDSCFLWSQELSRDRTGEST